MTQLSPPSLTAPRGHALAEAVRLAFAARGTGVDVISVDAPGLTVGGGAVRLCMTVEAGREVTLSDPIAILELVEDLHPDQPLHPRDPLRRAEHRQGLSSLPRLAVLIDRFSSTSDQRDVDLNAHLLRDQLGNLVPLLTPSGRTDHAYSLLDLAAAPFLWRVLALDRAFETHLLTGHDSLRERTVWLIRHPLLAEVLAPSLLAAWLEATAARGGLITRDDDRVDWSGALGPAGRSGKKVSSARQRTEIHSIGSGQRIR